MQWLTRFRALWVTCRSAQGSCRVPQHLRYQSVSAPGAPRWNDHDTPKEFNFARDVVDYWTQMEKEGKRSPNPALWWVNSHGDEVKWSFREVTDYTCRAANVFTQSCGLQKGDRLALILPRVPEWWLATLGCIRTGIIYVPGTTQMKAKDILYRLNKSKAKAIMTTDTLAPEVESVASECPALKIKLLVSDRSRDGWLNFQSLIKSASPDHTCVKSKTTDPMVIFFTSGTTGFPKMVKHSHGLALRSFLPSWKFLHLKMHDVLWCPSDPGWILATLGCLIEPWTAGCTVFIHHLLQFDPRIIVQTLFNYPITYCFSAPLVFRMILQQTSTGVRFPTLKHCCAGGDFLLPQEVEKWKEHTGLQLFQGYGQSETVPLSSLGREAVYHVRSTEMNGAISIPKGACYLLRETDPQKPGITCAVMKEMEVKSGSMGKAIPPFDVQIIDSKGNILPPNTEGNIGVRIKPTKPIGLFMCYENDPERTAEAECGDFYNTGDKATMDEEGYIWFLGRDDDIINASGYRIGPAEVENALAEHPAVAEVAVVSSPDPARGQVVKAFVVLTPQFLSHDPDQLTKELQQHVKSVTAPYKYPRKVEFVPELPKTNTGKIKRNELRNKEFGQM